MMDNYESLVIEVKGIKEITSEDTLNNYFSSSRHGGEITKIEYTEGSGRAFITFANAEGKKYAELFLSRSVEITRYSNHQHLSRR